MSAALKSFGTSAEKRVRKFTAALAASDAKLARLASAASDAEARFAETADSAPLRAAEAELAREQAERAALARGLEAAQRDAAAEEDAQAARDLEARHAALRVEVEKLGPEIVAALVALGRLFGRSAAIVDQLPAEEVYRHNWPPTLCEEANRRLAEGVKPKTFKSETLTGAPFEVVTNTGTREVTLTLVVPVGA